MIKAALASLRESIPHEHLSLASRGFFICHTLHASFTFDEIFNLTKIARWFLTQIKEIVDLSVNWCAQQT